MVQPTFRLSLLRGSLRLVLAVLAVLVFAPREASAQSFKKVIDRNFPVFFFCPIDPAATLTFTATGTDAILSFSADNFNAGSWNNHAVDNVAVVPQSVFLANQTQGPPPGYETCYIAPGPQNVTAYNFVAGSPEAYLNLFDTNATGWDLGPYGYYNVGSSAPRIPALGSGQGGDVSGGSLGLANTDAGSVRGTVSTTVTGLVPGTTYVVTGWWDTQNLSPLEIDVDFNVPNARATARPPLV